MKDATLAASFLLLSVNPGNRDVKSTRQNELLEQLFQAIVDNKQRERLSLYLLKVALCRLYNRETPFRCPD